MSSVTLMDILDARDRRAQRQQQLLAAYGCPLLSFTMNIPGPVKNSPLIRRGFYLGMERLQAALKGAGLSTLSPEVLDEPTGCEFLCAIPGDPQTIKALCAAIEEGSPLGRLFDMDVLDETGQKLSRAVERGCLICGAPGRNCASRRLHSVEELQQATEQRLRDGLRAADGARIGALVTQALLDEVDTTPKPGLVDKNNNGSHRDMTRKTFYDSAAALAEYWPDCFQIGVETASLSPEETFARLRVRGLESEKEMLRATGGVNTHKGAIFLLGILCGAIGRLWQPDKSLTALEDVCGESRRMVSAALRAEWAELQENPPTRLTAGEQLYLQYGIKGARGEAESGFLRVLQTSLPVFEKELSRGKSRNEGSVAALLALIAQDADTNMIHRGGLDRARQASREAALRLQRDPEDYMHIAAELDATFIAQNLSPGGCADLLSVTLFFHDLSLLFTERTVAPESR